MPSSVRFILKDSHELILEEAKKHNQKVQGRHYDSDFAEKTGNFKASELLYGLQMACLSITDDKKDTLKNVGKMNPWQIESLKLITGSLEKAHQPLTKTLNEQFDLTVDHYIDVHGMSKAGHALDTQGFIAHNDTTIVLSYRCTTSVADWLTNLTTTSSAWEIEEDVAQGHSGWWSCMAGCFGSDELAKPRVHTGFYNNFLVTVPEIRKYIDPLLGPDEPPRTLYVVGHSLGAGIATMAACYFLLEGYDWENLPHKLRIVTAGSPRACGKVMRDLVDAKLRELRKSDKALFARCVRDKDGVAKVPPRMFGFEHISEKLVYLTKEDPTGVSDVLINPDMNAVLPKRTLCHLLQKHPEILGEGKTKDDVNQATLAATMSSDDEDRLDYLPKQTQERPGQPDVTDAPSDEVEGNIQATKTGDDDGPKYKMVPQNLRDHMPEFYLKPLYGINAEDFDDHRLYAYESYNTSRDSSVEAAKPKKKFFRRRKKA